MSFSALPDHLPCLLVDRLAGCLALCFVSDGASGMEGDSLPDGLGVIELVFVVLLVMHPPSLVPNCEPESDSTKPSVDSNCGHG